jgi:hypothetical protein
LKSVIWKNKNKTFMNNLILQRNAINWHVWMV